MIEFLDLAWFIVKVLFSIFVMLLNSLAFKIRRFRSFVFLVISGLLLLSLIFLNQSKIKSQIPEELTPPPPFSAITTTSQQTEQKIRKNIATHEEILAKQPNHPDTLINIGLLHYSLGETNKAEEYWQKAFEIDPYHEFFSYTRMPLEE